MFNFIKKIFGCNHVYGEVHPDGYQYCKLCGRAILAPHEERCIHKWENVKTFNTTNTYTGNVIKITYVLRCVRCGEMKKEEY